MEKKFFFSIIEEAILNQDFEEEHPNYVGGRIEIWHNDYPHDIEEIRLLLPREIFSKIREALDMKKVDYFQIANIRSEDLEEKIEQLNKNKI